MGVLKGVRNEAVNCILNEVWNGILNGVWNGVRTEGVNWVLNRV